MNGGNNLLFQLSELCQIMLWIVELKWKLDTQTKVRRRNSLTLPLLKFFLSPETATNRKSSPVGSSNSSMEER